MSIFKNDKIWNFIFTLIFFSISIVAWKCIEYYKVDLTKIKIYDLFLIGMATFRLTRLLVYDEVFYYVKDFIVKYKTEKGFMKSISALISCPWCVSIWMAMLSVVVYVLVPYGKFIIIILAVASLANFFHLLIGLLGWVSDERKSQLKTTNKKRK